MAVLTPVDYGKIGRQLGFIESSCTGLDEVPEQRNRIKAIQLAAEEIKRILWSAAGENIPITRRPDESN